MPLQKIKTMLKYFKQELIFLPIMLVVLEIFRTIVFHFYPDTAVFDRGSELETFLMRMWQMVWIICAAWVLLRVTFPSVHKSMRTFYCEFETLDQKEQRSYALKFFCCLFFGLVFLMAGHGQVVSSSKFKVSSLEIKTMVTHFDKLSDEVLRKKLVDTLTSQLYVREVTGNNDGVEVERYLNYVGFGKGNSWCAAFASWNLNAVGVTTPPNPKSAWAGNFAKTKDIIWSPALVKAHKIIKMPGAGDCFTLYYSNMGRIGHVGFIVGFDGDYFITIEGNSGSSGSRDGEGVHKYKRAKMKVYAVTSYIQNKTTNEKITFNYFSPYFIINRICKLQSEIYTFVAEHSEYAERNFCEARHGDNTRYYIQVQRGYIVDYSACGSGQERCYHHAGNSNGIATDQTICIHYQWEGESRLHLQGAGDKMSASGETNNGIIICEPTELTYFGCEGNKGSEVCTKVDKGFGLDRRRKYIGCNHLAGV